MTEEGRRTVVTDERGWRKEIEGARLLAAGSTPAGARGGSQSGDMASFEILGKAPVSSPGKQDPQVYRYFWKPPLVTFGGFVGLVLLAGQFWLAPLLALADIQLGIFLPLVRIVAALLGIFLLVIAAPVYRPLDWTPEQDLVDRRDPDFYRSKPAR